MVEQIKTRMTAEEFWEFIEPRTERFELIDGEVIEMATPIPVHQDAVGETYTVVKDILKEIDGKAYIAPLEVYLDDENIPQPDVIGLLPNSRCVVGEKRLVGPPDLVVEVFSPSTRRYDKHDKFKLYERFGVREYWLVDPERLDVEVWVWVEGRYSLHGVFGSEDTFKSPTLDGQTVQVKTLFGV